MDPNERIEQFRKMAKANPEDDLAHFALGQALLEADRAAEAVPVLRHVIKMNAGYSKAYTLLGEAQERTSDLEGALTTWEQGYSAAINRGDLMVANDLKRRLSAHGISPQVDALVIVDGDGPADPDAGREPGEDEVRDHRTGRIGKKLGFDPFPDEVGAWIETHISRESWDAWMEMSIKVINELRLDLGDPDAQRTYDEQMQAFLNLPAELFEGREYE